VRAFGDGVLMNEVKHQGWGSLFDWKITQRGESHQSGSSFLAPQERRFLSHQHWSEKRVSDWLQLCRMAKCSALSVLEKIEPTIFREITSTCLSMNPQLTLCEVQSSTEKYPKLYLRTSVAQCGNYIAALSWKADLLKCGVDIKYKKIAAIFDTRWLFSEQERLSFHQEFCGYNGEAIEKALADWIVIGWSLKMAAFKASRFLNQSFNPLDFEIHWKKPLCTAGGEALAVPFMSEQSRSPLRCTWLESDGHIFAFAYNDSTLVAYKADPVQPWIQDAPELTVSG
jgi:hypothetical protein